MPPRSRNFQPPSQIADRAVTVLDYTSRVVGAIKDGNGDYLYAKLCEMERAVTSLASAVSSRRRFDGRAVTAMIEHEARHYDAGRRLFPVGGDPIAAARRDALRQVAGTMRFNPPEEVDAHTAGIVANWLIAQAEKPQ